MILIALDEGGHFEDLRFPQCNLIGGIVYECEDDEEICQEKKRLQKLFQTICDEQNAQYPYDLHFNWIDGKVINAESALRVKKALSAELPDYFCRKGRWGLNQPYRGRYSPFCMVGDRRGLDETNSTNLRDNVATVRYDHMVHRTVENILFYNPRYAEEKKAILHLPTRVVKANENTELQRQIRELGYSKVKKKDNTFDTNTYVVTDETGFRTGLESALLNSDRTDIQFELSVQTINYNVEQFHQMFLYLADTMCSVYQDAIYGCTYLKDALPQLYECGKKLTGRGALQVWAYHSIDQQWRKIWRHYVTGNWFEALKEAGLIQQEKNCYEKIYNELWVKPFEERLVKEHNPQILETTLLSLDNYMHDRKNVKLDLALYAARLLRENQSQYQDDPNWKKLAFQIAKISLAIYNHQGDYEHAGVEYKRCMDAATSIPVEEFMGIQLRYVVSLCDEKRYEEAAYIAKSLVSHHELLLEIKSDIWPDHSLINDSYGRAISQYAQCLAYQRKYEEATKYFKKAISQYEKGSVDWYITGSYLLHTLEEMEDRETYETFSLDFFGEKTIGKRIAAIRKRRCGNIGYALYVLLKGVWIFDKTLEKKQLDSMIKEILEMRNDAIKETHPWEMVMKYCALLRTRQSGEENQASAEELMQIARDVISEPKGILKEIMEENEKEYRFFAYGEAYEPDPKLNFIYR